MCIPTSTACSQTAALRFELHHDDGRISSVNDEAWRGVSGQKLDLASLASLGVVNSTPHPELRLFGNQVIMLTLLD